MTVLQVLGLHPYKLGGFEDYFLTFARTMRKRGHKVVFVFSGEPHPLVRERLQQHGCLYYLMPNPRRGVWGLFSFLYRLIRIVRRHRVDVIQGQMHPHSHYAVLAGFVTRTPSYRTIHSTTAQMPHPVGRLHIVKARISAALAQKTIAVSNAVRNDLVRQLRVPPKKIEVMHNGVDLDKYRPEAGDGSLHRELGIDVNSRIVLTVAHARPEKGLEFLIRAIPDILDVFPDVHFVFCGGGPLEKELADLGRRVGAEANIHFLGVRNDVSRLLNECHLFVLPSLADPLPLVVTEAMAMNKAVVATNVGGIPEMVEDRVTGKLVPPADAEALTTSISILLNDSKIIRRMGDAGRARVEANFGINDRVLREITMYENLVAGDQ